MPKVFNKRTDRIPPGAVYVGRPSKWGNPFKVKDMLKLYPGIQKYEAQEAAVAAYVEYLEKHPELVTVAKHELRGKDLVCWCAPLPCHAEILLVIANQ